MLKRFTKSIGIVLGGILCIQMNAFTAGTDAANSYTVAIKTATKGKVLATVNGESITQDEVNEILYRFIDQIDQEQIPLVTRQIVEGLVTQKLIMQFIRDENIEASQADVEAELNKVRNDAQANPELQGQTLEEVLGSHGGSIEDLKRDITISLSLEKHLEKDLSDQKIKAYFEENKSVYDGTEVKASHILVDTQNMGTEKELAQAREKINKAKAEVDAGKDFTEVARQYSDCPSKEQGGDLGFFERKGQMVEPFAAAAFSLKKGQVSGPIETQFGYHIIKVTEIKKGQDVNFDDIKRNVKVDMMSESLNVLLNELKQKAKIDIRV
jgi:parvulin-like peptidyl-prolyl isomerase